MIPVDTLLEKLANLTSSSKQTLVFTDPVSAASVKLEIDQLDSLACQLWDVEVVTGKTPALSLNDRTQLISQKITGLLEPIKTLEIDPLRGIAQLRSDPPAQKNKERLYYELLMEKTGRTTVRRYEGSYVSMERKRIPFTLTREALAKLVSDLSS